MPMISVVMPIYNGASYLNEALDSVFSQTFTDYEVICVDDGSTDDSLPLLARYGNAIKLFRQPNGAKGRLEISVSKKRQVNTLRSL